MSHMDGKNLNEYFSIIPIIQYALYRQINDDYQNLRKEILQDLVTLKNEDALSKQVTIMKLIILFTREVN